MLLYAIFFFLQKKQEKLTFARSILYLKSSSQWTLLRNTILSSTYHLVYKKIYKFIKKFYKQKQKLT